jgi:hypothetical protein
MSRDGHQRPATGAARMPSCPRRRAGHRWERAHRTAPKPVHGPTKPVTARSHVGGKLAHADLDAACVAIVGSERWTHRHQERMARSGAPLRRS